MPSKEFWEDDPKLFSSYLIAFKHKEERNIEYLNYSNWLQGLYIFDSNSKSLRNFGMQFLSSKKTINSMAKYIEEPLDILNNKEKKKQIEKEKVRQTSQDNLNYWATIKK